MRKTHATIHDNFIRAILSDREIAIAYFQNFLPVSISDQLVYATLTQIPDTYLSDELQKSMSDMVYCCQLKDSEETIRITLLIEHKSYPDNDTPIQIGNYIFSGYAKQLKNREDLSVIVPLLLYHGKGKWAYKPLSSMFKHAILGWERFIPDYDYIYNNLGEISDEEVKKLENKFLVASLLALKHTFKKNWIEDHAIEILILSADASENLQSNLAVYLFAGSRLDEEAILEILQALPLKLKHTIMNTLDIVEEKGVQKGIVQGIEMGKMDVVRTLLLNTDFSESKIAILTGISELQVRKIKSEIKK